MTAKHSPGPWVADGFHVAIPADPATGSYTYIVAKGPNAKANIRLIAAAPELLETLKEAEYIAVVHKLPLFEARVRAAIAKAEGKS